MSDSVLIQALSAPIFSLIILAVVGLWVHFYTSREDTDRYSFNIKDFITRKQWFIAGTDDMHLRVYNYNTMDKVKEWEAHTDYIRYVEIHPNRPYILR